MSTKITISGFQSIVEPLELELEGFTAIVGESNLGKTSIIRALVAALTNRKGSDFVSVDASHCEVKIENNNHVLVWRKGSKKTEYLIDGKEFLKAGKSTPLSEIAKLGFSPVLVQGKSFFPQIQRQLDKPFIIAESSPSISAELLAASKYTQILVHAIKDAQKDHSKKHIEVELRRETLKSMETRLNALNLCKPKLMELRTSCAEAYSVHQVLKSKLESLRSLKEAYQRNRNLLDNSSLIKIHAELPPPIPKFTRSPLLISLCSFYFRARSLAGLYQSHHQFSMTLPVLCSPKILSLYQSYKRFQRLDLCFKSLTIPTLPQVSSPTYKNLLQSWFEVNQVLTDSSNNGDQIAMQFKTLDAEFKQILDTTRVCPICKHPLSSSPLLSGKEGEGK